MPPVMPVRVYLYADEATGTRLRVVGASEQPTTFTQLAVLLEQMHEHMGSNDPVIIQPVGKVKWEDVLNAFNAAVKAKCQNVQFGEQSQ
jgi:biopolymer transport protein ExbD